MLVIGYDLKIFIKDFGKDKKLIYLCIQIQKIMTQSINQIANGNGQSVAFLSSHKNMTSFSFGNQTIRFRAPDKLIRYTAVKEWDKGYIVVMAKYADIGEVEEYIDLVPILQNLYIDKETFLNPIKTLKIKYD